jgi:hypothetical protein
VFFGINFRNTTINDDGVKLTAVRKPAILDEGGNQLGLPGFITFNAASNIFKVEGATAKDFGDYTIALVLGYAEYPSYEVVCKT